MSILPTFAQAIVEGIDNAQIASEVKLVDEFFDRFNGKEVRKDVKGDDLAARHKNLMLLFNGAAFKSLTDPRFIEAGEMMDTVISQGVKLKYSDPTWVAKAKCHGTLKGKAVDFYLYLTVENRTADMYKWVISKAEGKIFQLTPSIRNEKIMLYPDDHETNFMSLSRATTEKDDCITNYARKGFIADQTSVFYTYVYSGQLNIDHVSELEFIFLEVPGYQFTISHFKRETMNSGWLISDFKKMSDEEKNSFLHYIYD